MSNNPYIVNDGYGRIIEETNKGATYTLRHVIPGDILYPHEEKNVVEWYTAPAIEVVDIEQALQQLYLQNDRDLFMLYRYKVAPAKTSILEHLKWLYNNTPRARLHKGVPAVTITHEELRQDVFLTRESTTKLLRQLAEEGQVTQNYGVIQIHYL